jgi:hypothetical protein
MVLLHGEDKCSKWIHESLEMILQAFVKGVFTCFLSNVIVGEIYSLEYLMGS